MKRILLIAFLLAGLISVKAQKKFDTPDYAILPYDSTTKWLFNKKCKAANITENEIADVENILSKCINNYNLAQTKYFNKLKKEGPEYGLQQKNFVIDLTKYKRQFIAVINSKGEKEVWVNCFRPFENFSSGDWRQTIVSVDDGGNYFFNVKVNLTSKKYFNFRVNGYA